MFVCLEGPCPFVRLAVTSRVVALQLMRHIEPIKEPKLSEVKLFRDFWLYCIVMGFSDFQIGGH